ncbi:MAG: 16S rRNA (cytosine(967)-C(5))-methyltransferase RsmB [Gemmatimonadaceae bacterium]|nr:16S rRNA (cytosine(967)-C(5))-methyltransferase RsmB [Gemmatimonadaceae bacterium]
MTATRAPGRPNPARQATDARIVAADVCADLRRGEFLDPAFERRTAMLDVRDRRWTRELVYGMLRRRGWIDAVLEDRVKNGLARLTPELRDLLRLGSYQLLFMGSVPPYAAIAQTVELAKRRDSIGAGGLANAVLRRIDRERDELGVVMPADPLAALAIRDSHPEWLVSRWAERFGYEGTSALLVANNAEAPLVARPVGISPDDLAASLREAGVEVEPAPLAAGSLTLRNVGALTALGAFRQGQLHLQDPASTLVTQYAAFPAGAVVGDLCAAPGGKGIELARTAAHVLSADISEARLQRVIENIERLGIANQHPLVADARRPALDGMDGVLIDVPCTGTGTFRRHPDGRWRLKPSDLAVMGVLQRDILRAAAGAVRPGGLLVYSTCSLEPEENDDQVDRFLNERPEWRLEPPPEGRVPTEVLDAGRLRVLPQRHGTDGAFAARLRRAA